MREVAWISFHIVIALPLALVLSVIAREAVRTLVALATGLRVFEVRIGVGQRLFSAPVGPVDLSLAVLPLGGALVAAGADAMRHRIRHGAVALSPLLAQFGWLAWYAGRDNVGLAPLQAGFAPITILAVAQVGLFVLHLLVPIRWSAEEQTDLRSFVDLVLGTAHTRRRSRASYYVRLARHSIERGQVEAAHAALQKGLTQLGPEPLLVECETILATRELISVVDQDESAEALLVLLNWTPSDNDPRDNKSSSFERFQRYGVYVLPLLVALAFFAGTHRDTLSGFLQARWIDHGGAILETASAEACAAHRRKAESWPITLNEAGSAAIRRDHHHLLARLLACEGDLPGAQEAVAPALAEAEKARAAHFVGTILDPPRWIEDEIQLATVLRRQGELALRQGTYGRALQALARAERELNLVRHQLGQATDEDERPKLIQRIDAQQAQIRAQRSQIQTEMAAR